MARDLRRFLSKSGVGARSNGKQEYLDECHFVEENSLYNAETHYLMANSLRLQMYYYQVFPAAVAAVSSLVSVVWSTGVAKAVVAALSASVAAIATVLNPNKRYEDHLNAGRSFTALRHDARFLKVAEVKSLVEEAFEVRVRHLHERYNDLCKTTLATDDVFFEKARAKIQSGRHSPDLPGTGVR